MKIQGFDIFREKLPSYEGIRILVLLLIAASSFLFGGCWLLIFYLLPSYFPNESILSLVEPILPILGQIILLIIGFCMISRIWQKKKALLKKSPEFAYQEGIIYGLVGIPLVLVTAIHNYLPFYLYWDPTTSITKTLSSTFIIFNHLITVMFQLISSLFFLGLGLSIILYAISIIGFDYLAFIYLYYPEESVLQKHHIYSIVRHPIYFAVIIITLGGGFAHLSIYSFITFVLISIALKLHLKFIEEKELIERFGESYITYMRETPGLYIRFKVLRNIIIFLIENKSFNYFNSIKYPLNKTNQDDN